MKFTIGLTLLSTLALSSLETQTLLAQLPGLYGATAADGGTGGELHILDPSDGSVISTIGSLENAAGDNYRVTGLAWDQNAGILYGSTANMSDTSPGSLITINPTSGEVFEVGSYLFSGQTMADITLAPNGKMYGWLEPEEDDLFEINIVTGAATLVGESSLITYGAGLAADSRGTLFFTGTGDTFDDFSPSGPDIFDDGTLMTISTTDGAPTAIAALTGGSDNFAAINALDFSPNGVLYGSLNDGPSFGGTGYFLTTIDTVNGNISVLGPTIDRLDGLAFVVPEPTSFAALLLMSPTILIGRRRRI